MSLNGRIDIDHNLGILETGFSGDRISEGV